jgi:hypothetical protein
MRPSVPEPMEHLPITVLDYSIIIDYSNYRYAAIGKQPQAQPAFPPPQFLFHCCGFSSYLIAAVFISRFY